MPDTAPEFTEVSLRGRQESCAAPAAVLHTGAVTVELFGDTPRELVEGAYETSVKALFAFRNGTIKFFICFSVSGI